MIDVKRKEMGVFFDKNSDKESFDRVMTWIDINAPYYPNYGSSYRENMFGRSPLTNEQMERLRQLTGNNDWEITFRVCLDRPEISPLLKTFVTDGDLEAAKKKPEYQETLAIIKAGQAALAAQDRGEDPNWTPSDPIEIGQEKRYQRMAKREKMVREAILDGRRVTDQDFMKGEKP